MQVRAPGILAGEAGDGEVLAVIDNRAWDCPFQLMVQILWISVELYPLISIKRARFATVCSDDNYRGSLRQEQGKSGVSIASRISAYSLSSICG